LETFGIFELVPKCMLKMYEHSLLHHTRSSLIAITIVSNYCVVPALVVRPNF